MQPNEKSNREIVTTRIFNASQETMFNAWTDPQQLAKWWGPKGFANTFHRFELKPGGQWKFTMHTPDGKDFENECVFMEIRRPESLVFKHLLPVHEFVVTATFKALDEHHTRTTFRMLFNTAEECEWAKQYVIEANEQNFDRLETVINQLVP